MRCFRCSRKVPNDAKKCPYCGFDYLITEEYYEEMQWE